MEGGAGGWVVGGRAGGWVGGEGRWFCVRGSLIESFYCLGTCVKCRHAKIFSAEEREAKVGTRERGNANLRTRKQNVVQERGSAGMQRQNQGTRDAKHFRNARPSLKIMYRKFF